MLPMVGSAQVSAAALNFDGTDDFVELPSDASLTSYVTTGEFTLEFWIRPEVGQTDYTPISNRVSSNAQGFVMEYYANELHTWTRYGNSWIDAPVALTAGIWQHVAIVANSMSGTETYVDGVLTNSTAASGSFSTPNAQMRLGGDIASPGTRIFGGDMDEVRIWNRALCAVEIAGQKDCELAGTESGLVAYYQFNQGTVGADNSAVTSLSDLTPNGNDGTLTNFTDLAAGGSASNWVAPGGVTSGIACGPVNAPEITVNDASATKDFSDVILNTTADLSFIIDNDGLADLEITGISSDNPLFSITLPANTTIAAGNNEAFTVTFAPTAAGPQSANISIQSNDCDEAPYEFEVMGVGAYTWVSVNPAIELGAVTCFCNGNQQLTITDAFLAQPLATNGADGTGAFVLSSPQPLRFQNMPEVGANNGDLWTVTATGGSWTATGPNSSTTGSDLFLDLTNTSVPLNRGESSAAQEFTLTKRDASGGGLLLFYALEACPMSPEIAANEVAIGTDLGETTIAESSTLSYTISNSGPGDLIIADITSNNALFTTTLPANTTISENGSETFMVTFAPTAVGAQSSTISIAYNDCDESPYTFTVSGTGIEALPVDYLSLSATAKKDHIGLEWATENEEVNLGFFVERRAETEAGFQEIGFVPAAGTSAADYSFNDRQVLAATNYVYRLRQTDFDESTAYSPLISARTQDAKNGLTAWPNPTTGALFVRASFSVTRAYLYDATGRAVRSFSLADGRGETDLSDLSAGVYFLRAGDAVRRVMK